MIEENLRAYLASKSGITNIVGTQIYPSHIPQGISNPCLVFTRISGPRERTLNTGRPGLASPLFQIDCFADDYTGVKALAEQVRLALEGYKGLLSGSVNALAVHFFGDSDSYDPDLDEHRVIMEFEIWHNES